jgi:hypothetical protein
MPPREAANRLYRHARREAIIVILVWLLTITWTLGYCYLRGYDHAPDSWPVRWGLALPRAADDLHQWAGFPDWILFGIILPWAGCTLFTLVFASFGMADDDLGIEMEEGGGHGH